MFKRQGKFHGTIAPTTPIGVNLVTTFLSVVSSNTSSSTLIWDKARSQVTHPPTSNVACGVCHNISCVSHYEGMLHVQVCLAPKSIV